MAGLTEYRFDGSGSSDPNEDVLTYSWNFGDGSRGSGVTATHLYPAAGMYDVTLTVSDGSAEATSSGSVRVGPDLEGRFVATFWEPISPRPAAHEDTYCARWHRTHTLDLRQDGRTLTGSLDAFKSRSDRCESHHYYLSVSGTIGSANDFVCPCEVHLQMQLVGTTHGADVNNTDPVYQGEGVVAAGADSIDLRYAVFRRQ